MKSTTYPLVKLPPSIEYTLYLIKEELKSQKFFKALYKAGIDSLYQPDLGKLILVQLGMNIESDEVLDFYYKVIDKRCKRISDDSDSVMIQTVRVYVELLGEKKRIQSSKISG